MRLGAHEKTGSGGKFFVIKHHCICEESKLEKQGFEPREVTNPQTNERLVRYIKPYGSLIGYVTGIEYRDTENRYDQQYVDWRISLNLGDSQGVLTIPFHSRHSTRFMMLAENVDYSRPVEFRAWKAPDDSTGFYVGQFPSDDAEESVKVAQKYKKGEMGDCPEGVQRLGGKWNFDDQNQFLYERMMSVVVPMVEAAQRNGHVPGGEAFTAEPEPEPELSREEMITKVQGLCTQLNADSDEIKWGKASLNNFVNETYQVTDGMDSMTPVYLAKLIRLLNERLEKLEVPF